MVRRTPSGSLYGSVDILGKPTNTKGRKGIIPQYRLVTSLRLHPAQEDATSCARAPAQVRNGTFVLPVRNLGNTIEPVSGHLQAVGPGSRSGSFESVSVIPGKLVAWAWPRRAA